MGSERLSGLAIMHMQRDMPVDNVFQAANNTRMCMAIRQISQLMTRLPVALAVELNISGQFGHLFIMLLTNLCAQK